jgi:hypothetical protein
VVSNLRASRFSPKCTMALDINLFVLVPFSFLLARLSAAGNVFPRACAWEAGRGSRSHERALNRLNGRGIVFVGDSVSRYQYLELAYYVTHGKCPDKLAPEYILSAYAAGFPEATRWISFYNSSTSQLNFKGDVRWSKETCFCARMDLLPGQVVENRAFEYQDIEVRYFQQTGFFVASTDASGFGLLYDCILLYYYIPLYYCILSACARLHARHVVFSEWLRIRVPFCSVCAALTALSSTERI